MSIGIAAHGGLLINREASGAEREHLLELVESLPRVILDERQASDVEMIAVGGFSPLTGFMGKDDYDGVVDSMRLGSGVPWSLPVTLTVSDSVANDLTVGSRLALADADGAILAVMDLSEKFKYDKEKEALQVYGTEDLAHPGVAYLAEAGTVALGGEIILLNRSQNQLFPEHRMDPAATRKAFRDRGWKRIVGFQTRNPVHRAHEYIQKCALEAVDGLLLHPLVGATKSDDIPADVRMKCYRALIENYYPKDRVLLSVFPAAMRYAGPREAVFHAIVRKNYGCTHFIVGRDHAGVGSYYGTFDAHYIFDEFEPGELGIQPMFFDHTFYCSACGSMASYKTCPHDSGQHVVLSGTKVRDMLRDGKMPPREVSRREVAEILVQSMKQPAS